MIEGSYSIELKFVGDGRVFLNYWDIFHGDDVCAEVVDGSLYDDNEEISLADFLKKVEKSVKRINYNQ